jgi:hypothetical protein
MDTVVSTSRAETAGSSAPREVPAAGSAIVAWAPFTSKSDAAPASDQAPPTGAVPHPFTADRPNPSAATVVACTSRYAAVTVAS